MRRSSQGAAAKRHGKVFEGFLEKWFSLQKNIDIRKQNEALKPIRSLGSGKFLAVYTQPSGCDYFGTMVDGKAVVLEAKHRESDKIAKSDLTPMEISHLEATAALGAYALVVTEFSDGSVCMFPWQLLRDSEALYGLKHIKKEELISDGFVLPTDRLLSDSIKNCVSAYQRRIRNGSQQEMGET